MSEELLTVEQVRNRIHERFPERGKPKATTVYKWRREGSFPNAHSGVNPATGRVVWMFTRDDVENFKWPIDEYNTDGRRNRKRGSYAGRPTSEE